MADGRDTYQPSWVDRLIDRIDSWPMASWAPYAAVFIAVTAVANGLVWAERVVPFGTIDPYTNSLAAYMVLGYAAIHYLDHAVARAWTTLRPALSLEDDAANRAAHELTTMPAGPTLASTLLGVVLGVVYLGGQYGKPLDLAGEPVTFIVASLGILGAFTGTANFVYHTIRQLRLIGGLARDLGPIDVLHLRRLHAFAPVTATTGVVLLAIGYLALPTNPYAFSNPAVVGLLVATIGLAIACFVVPLSGIHDAIVEEKWRRLEAVNGLLDQVLSDLHREVGTRELREADAHDKQLTSLLAERDLLARTQTWPWASETLRGFVTALVLPIAVWLVLRVLDRALG